MRFKPSFAVRDQVFKEKMNIIGAYMDFTCLGVCALSATQAACDTWMRVLQPMGGVGWHHVTPFCISTWSLHVVHECITLIHMCFHCGVVSWGNFFFPPLCFWQISLPCMAGWFQPHASTLSSIHGCVWCFSKKPRGHFNVFMHVLRVWNSH